MSSRSPASTYRPTVHTATVETPTGWLPIRAEPRSTACVIGQLTDGEVLSLCSRCGSWFATYYDGRKGYLPADCLVLHY